MRRRDILDVRWLVLLLALALPGLVEAQSVGGAFIQYYPPAGVSGLTGTATTITSALPILLPDGSTAAPGLGFASEPGLGFNRISASVIGVTYNNSVRWGFVGATSNLQLVSYAALAWTTAVGSAGDTFLSRDGAAATIQIGIDAATATAQTFKGADSTGATITGASLTVKGGNGTSGIANGGALVLSGGANSSTGEPGAVRIADGGTKPTCDAARRGSIWYDAGSAGVADTFEVCAKAAAGDAYGWYALATIP